MLFTIVGLGNPGDEYKNTRHNIGWIILSEIVSQSSLPSFSKSAQYSGLLSEGIFHEHEVGILLPTTFMNNSGVAVAKYIKDRSSLDALIVIHDDVDLAFGEVRISKDRGAGGHNGVKSIIDACGGKNFIRIRVGVAQRGFFGGIKRPTGEKLSNFVLGVFTSNEQKQLSELREKVERALTLILEKGVQNAMQEMNGKE